MSASELILHLLLLGLCFIGAGFFAGIETGVISINRLRLHHVAEHGQRGAKLIEQFLAQPERLLGTTLVGTNVCQTTFAVLLTSLLIRLGLPGAAAVANVSGALVLLVFCEYLPKAWFQAVPIQRTLPLAGLLEFTARIFRPFALLVSGIVQLILGKTIGGEKAQPLLTREELIHLAAEGAEIGALTPYEGKMIHGVFDLSGTRCRDIMVPADRIIRIEADLSSEKLIALARERELNRFPVWDPAQKKFIGIVHIFDVLSDPGAAQKTARAYLRPPQFVAGHMLVDHVLPRMRATRQPLTLVTNEPFEVIGLITMNDVLSVIVGSEDGIPRAAKPAQAPSPANAPGPGGAKS